MRPVCAEWYAPNPHDRNAPRGDSDLPLGVDTHLIASACYFRALPYPYADRPAAGYVYTHASTVAGYAYKHASAAKVNRYTYTHAINTELTNGYEN